MKGWGESVSTVCVGKNIGNCIQYFFYRGVVYILYMLYFKVSCVYFCSSFVCIVVVVLCVT